MVYFLLIDINHNLTDIICDLLCSLSGTDGPVTVIQHAQLLQSKSNLNAFAVFQKIWQD